MNIKNNKGMKRNKSSIALLTFLMLIMLPFWNIAGIPPFTAGNLAVLQMAASASNTTASIIELKPYINQTSAVYSFSLSGTGSNALRFSGSAATTGYLSTSNDGSQLCISGVNTSTTTGNTNTLNPRGVGVLNSLYSFSLPTTYTGVSGNQPRGVTSIDNLNYYFADQGGFYTNGTSVASPTGNIRCVKSFGGTVYAFTALATMPSVGILSAISGGTLTGLNGLPSGTSYNQDFYLISSGNNGNSYDVLYIVTATTATAGTIYKYSLVNGSWVANNYYNTTFGGFGMCAAKNGTSAYLYITTGLGSTTNNSVIRLIDNAGYNTNINITTANNLTLYTATGSTILKGIAFAPQFNTPVVQTGTTTNINIISATCLGNVISDGGSTIIQRGICYDTTAYPDTSKNKIIVSGTVGSFSANLSGLNSNTTYHYRAFALNSTGITYGADSTFTTQTSYLPTKLVIITFNNNKTISANTPFSIIIQAQDITGVPKNTPTDIKVVLTSTGSIGGNTSGYITAGTNGVIIQGVTLAAGFNITITASDSANVLASATSSPFNVLEAASKLLINGIQSTALTNQVLTTFTVQALRTDNTLDSNFNANIVLNPSIIGSGSMYGTLSKTAVNGIATYNDIYFDQPGICQVNASSTGLSSLISSVIIYPAPQMVELVVPKYIGCKNGSATNTERTPISICFQLKNLQPDTIYDLRVQLGLITDTITASGAGNTWDGSAFSTNVISHAFTTDDNGNSSPIWVLFTTTGNATRFDAGQVHNIRVGYAKTGNTIPSAPAFIGTKTITALDIAKIARTTTTLDDGAFLRGTVDSIASGKYVLLYDNTNGIGDPLASYQIRQTLATQASQTDLPRMNDSIYMQAGSSIKGDYAVVIPIGTNNTNGIQRIEIRNADNTIFSFNTSLNGTWANGVNTTIINRRDSIYITNITTINTIKTLNITAMLQEYFNGTGMNQTQGINWNTGILFNNFGDSIVDTLTVLIRETNVNDIINPCSIDTIFYGLNLYVNGNILPVSIPTGFTGYHYIEIIHRNSVDTWSDSVDFSVDTINYNFYTHISKFAMDGGMYIDGSNLAYIWGGDVNQNGNLESEDATQIYVAAISDDETVNNGYVINDVDGNGNIDSQDYGLAYSNSITGANVINPFSYQKK